MSAIVDEYEKGTVPVYRVYRMKEMSPALQEDSDAVFPLLRGHLRRPAPSPAGQAVSFAPLTANATVGVHSKSSDAPAPYVPPRADRQNQGVTLMIIGGAALLGGAIIAGSSNAAGTLLMVGGVVCGAIGLYKYLQ
jgi:hypothetical protein